MTGTSVPQVLTFTVNEADMIAFNRYLVATNPRLKQTYLIMRGGFALLPVFFMVLYGGWHSYTVTLGVLLGVLIWFLWPLFLRSSTTRTVRRTRRLQEAPAEDPFQVWLDDWGLHSNTRLAATTIWYHVVQSIADTPEYVYILLGPMQALVIPKNKVAPADLGQFLAELRRRLPACPYTATGT